MLGFAFEWARGPALASFEWVGHGSGISSARDRDATPVLAGLVGLPGPAGPAGPSGAPIRLDVAAPAAVWTIPHGLGRVPAVQVFLSTGEQVFADIEADGVNLSVTFAAPVAGFVLVS